jgi:thiol-disulfide isomerase/thioredoxin
MNIVLIVVFVLLGLLVVWQWKMAQKARDLEGSEAPDTSAVDGAIDARAKVYFFHATHCRPCKSMMPLVDELRQDFPNLIKLEVGENIALARAFRIAGTPSFIAVRDGLIEEVKLGMTDEDWLRGHLA